MVTAQLGSQPLGVRLRKAGQAYGAALTASFDPAYPGAEGCYVLEGEVSH